MFKDRDDAAHQLADRLAPYRGRHPLVLAIPRGAVPMGKVIAEQLGGDLDVVLVRKLGAPGAPEVAVGSVAESGWTYIGAHAPAMGAGAGYLADETQAQLATIRARRAQYTPIRPAVDPQGRLVIVVDDGLAMGATMIAALHSVRQHQPAQLVCAIPVAAPDALERVRPMADAVVCLFAPANFHAVGQFYRDFRQVEDAEVVALLRS
jgi:predicted phosphoribosyltransferase